MLTFAPNVRWVETHNRWEPWIEIGSRVVFLGLYKTEAQARKAYIRRFRRERLKLIRQIHSDRQLRLSL